MQPVNQSSQGGINKPQSAQQAQRRLTVHVVQHLKPGGIEALVLEMLRRSTPRDRSIVISLEGDRASAIKAWSKLAPLSRQLLFLDKPSGVSPSTVPKLCRLFKVLQPDVVHTHHIGPLLYAGCAARLSDVACVIHTEHDGWHFDNRKRARLQSLALNVVKPRLVADAQFVAKQLSKRFEYTDLSVIKNGVDCERFKPASQALARQRLGLPLNQILVGCAGRLEFVKGHDVLIHALAKLDPQIHLAIAGIGSQLDNLQELAQSLGVADRIHWLGLVDDMPRFYQSLDLFCLPSRNEGLPLSTLEAQACGITSIATHVGAVSETLCPNSSILVTKENPRALAQAIDTVQKRQTPASPRDFVSRNNDLKQMMDTYKQLAMESI